MDWIALAQDRDKWRNLVNAVLNLGVPKKCREFLNQLRTDKLLMTDCFTQLVMSHRHNISTDKVLGGTNGEASCQ